MNASRQVDPRANQKARTRAALVEAAGRLLRAGRPPTVAEAADEAKVSRATAYRYFPTQEALLVEVSDVNPATAPIDALLAGDLPAEPAARLRALQDAFNRIALKEEVAMRTALRGYLDAWLAGRREGAERVPVREGRRVRWLDQALAPVRERLSPAAWRRLRAALALTLNVEAIVVLKDVCGLEDDEEVLDVLAWAGAALLRAGLEERAAPRRRARR